MKNKHIYINVYLSGLGFVNCGVITFNNQSNYSAFSYFEDYINKGLPSINPATLNYKSKGERHFIIDKTIEKELLDKTFWELIPNENDWGDHVLSSEYEMYEQFTKLHKLHYLNNRQVGGLESFSMEPENENSIKSINLLDRVRDNSINFYLRNIEKISYIKAIKPLTGYGGVRPKCMFEDDKGDFWIAKFNLPSDSHDMSKFEKTTLDIAKESGLNVADTKLMILPSGQEVLLSKRFDRTNEERFHSLSFFALMNKNEITKGEYQGNPGTYVKILIDRYSDFKDSDTINLINKYLIDIALNNTDNHLRNIRLLLNKENKWEMAPNFDIVANHYEHYHIYNPLELNSNEVYLLNPDLPYIIEIKYGVKSSIVKELIGNIVANMEKWEEFCDRNNMSYEDKIKFCNAINIGLNKKKTNTMKMKSTPSKKNELPKFTPKNN